VTLGELDWQLLPERRASRIIKNRPAALDNRDAWPELTKWLIEQAALFKAGFAERVRQVDVISNASNAEHEADAGTSRCAHEARRRGSLLQRRCACLREAFLLPMKQVDGRAGSHLATAALAEPATNCDAAPNSC
jgi:hypothetical protein